MKLFVDSADLVEIEDALKKGVVQGITTNPSLVAKVPQGDVGKPFVERYVEHMRKIADLCRKYKPDASLSVEVFTENPAEMVQQAEELVQKIGYGNLAIKIPAGWQELEAVRELSRKGIKVNYTCCFSEGQMEQAALAGARYVSLFHNRLKDANGYPLKVLENTRKFLDRAKLNCEIIDGSIRNQTDITEAWGAGAHIVTAGLKHIQNMAFHPKTVESVEGFLKDLREWMK